MNGKITEYFKMRKMTLSFFGKSQYRDWKILIILSFVGAILASLFGYWMYSDLNEGELFTPQATFVPHKKIDEQVLTTMIQKLDEKKTNSENLKTQKPQVTDPSL